MSARARGFSLEMPCTVGAEGSGEGFLSKEEPVMGWTGGGGQHVGRWSQRLVRTLRQAACGEG